MSDIFQEILKSFEGAAQTDVGAAKAGAIKGARGIFAAPVDASLTGANKINLIDLASAHAAQAGPPIEGADAIMGIDPSTVKPDGQPVSGGHEALFSSILAAVQQERTQASGLTPPAPPETITVPGMPIPQEQAMSLPDSAPPNKPRSTPVQTQATGQRAPEGSNFEDLAKQAGRVFDRNPEKAKAEAERNAALKRADGEREMSDEEKVATALLGVAPGLLGAIFGGAISGGYGAAAGAAGGLQGGAQGVATIAAGKEAKRKEAKDEATKIQERIARIDEQIAVANEKAQDQELNVRLREREQQRAEKLDHEKMAMQEKIAREGNRTQLTGIAMTQRGAMDRTLVDARSNLEKAQLAAKASGIELKDYQGKSAQFATSMLMSKHVLDEMKDPNIWNTMRTWSGLQAALSDPARQKYARAALNFIEAAARDVSGAAIQPNEYEAKFQQYLPVLGSSAEDIEYAKNFRDSAVQMMLAKAGPGRNMAIQAVQDTLGQGPQQQTPQPQQAQGSHGPVVHQNGHTFQWDGSQYVQTQ